MSRKKFDKEKIEQLLINKINNHQLVAETLTTTKTKKNGVVFLCPFHYEKTPSFRVHKNGTLHCYGCGAHFHNIINYVMEIYKISYPEAIVWLAKKYQVKIKGLKKGRT